MLFLFIFLLHIGMAVLYALLTRGVADMNHLIQQFNVEYDLEPGKVTFGAMYWITVSVNTVGTYSRIGLLQPYETYSRIGLLQVHGNFQSYCTYSC